jgi:hypothetical protein
MLLTFQSKIEVVDSFFVEFVFILKVFDSFFVGSVFILKVFDSFFCRVCFHSNNRKNEVLNDAIIKCFQ